MIIKFLKSKKGVSPIISTILIFAIVMSATVMVYSWGLPLVINMREKSYADDVSNQFFEMDRNIKKVVHEGVDSSATTQFELESGVLTSEDGYFLSNDALQGPQEFNVTFKLRYLDDGTNSTINALTPSAGELMYLRRITYVLRSTMDDLSINETYPHTQTINHFVVSDHPNCINQEISRIVYTRTDATTYSVYMEYRPWVIIDYDDASITIFSIRLVNGSDTFPRVGSPKLVLTNVRTYSSQLTRGVTHSGSSAILYAEVNGELETLSKDVIDIPAGGITVNFRIIEIKIS